MKKIIAFSGSNSSSSINQRLVKIVVRYITKVEVEVINLTDYPAELFGVDIEKEKGFPETMIALQSKLLEADGFIVSTPEHNGSMPAFFKNTIDWLSRISPKVLNDKPTIFFSTSPGARGGASALQHLMAILPYRGVDVLGGYSVKSFNDSIVNEDFKNETDRIEVVKLLNALEEAL